MRVKIAKAVSRDESADGRIVKTRFEVVKPKLRAVVIAAIEESVPKAKPVCRVAVIYALTAEIAPSILPEI